MTDLDKLIDAVQAGEFTASNWRDFSIIPTGHHEVPGQILAHRAYHGSLDAAKALHEALLPGWWWSIGTCRVSDDARVSPEGDESVMTDGTEWAEFTDIDRRPPGNPARAWLLSILIAYRDCLSLQEKNA